jgi:mortality factor 4-like protein 1
LNLPETLKIFLVDDWEAVTKNNQVGVLNNGPLLRMLTFMYIQLVTLPRTPTVVELLDEFAAYVVETKPPGYVFIVSTFDSYSSFPKAYETLSC